jgi:CheY-like chemotaxis protein
MDGLIATMVIRDEEREGEHIPIVALTAHAGREDIRKCFDAGMDAYLAKPVRKKELFKVISEVVSIAPGAFQP